MGQQKQQQEYRRGTPSVDRLNPNANCDGPKIQHTLGDLFRAHPTAFMAYHVSTTPFAIFNTLGVVLGGGLYYGLGLRGGPSVLAAMGTAGSVAGCAGAMLGLWGMAQAVQKGNTATPIPWNDVGIQQRVDGLSHNYKVRALDVGLWSGIGLAVGAVLWSRGTILSAWRLNPGSRGVVQAVSLGAALGTVGGMGSILVAMPTRKNSSSGKDEDETKE